MKEKIEAFHRLERDKRIIQDAQRRVRDDLVSHCPLKPGDEVRVPSYQTHENKPCTVKQVVTCKGWQDDLVWRIKATLTKKDGTPSKRHASWVIPVPKSQPDTPE